MARTQRLAYSLSEFARMSGLSPSTVKARMDAGDIPELRRLGGRRFIPVAWVEAWAREIVNEEAS